MNSRHSIASIALGLLVSTGATALDVNVVGLFPNKAVVQIEGGALQTLSVGQKTRDNIILLSVERDGATFDIQGRRVALSIGPARRQTSPAVVAQTSPAAAANYAAVQKVLEQRCYMCHGAQVQMKNVRLDSAEALKQHAQSVYQQAVVTKLMPMNNATGITDAERGLIAQWFQAGAPIR